MNRALSGSELIERLRDGGPLGPTQSGLEAADALEDAYKTIRALVGHSGESCASDSCPHERAVRKALGA